MAYIDPEKLIKELAAVGLKKLKQDNERKAWRIHMQERKLEQANEKLAAAIKALGDPDEKLRLFHERRREIEERKRELDALLEQLASSES